MLKAIIVMPNTDTTEIGAILAIARSSARRREHAQQNPPIRALKFFPELGLWVAVYEVNGTQKPELKKLQRVRDAVLKDSSGS